MAIPTRYPKAAFVVCAVGYEPIILGGIIVCQLETQSMAVPITQQGDVPPSASDFELVAAVANKRIVVAAITLAGTAFDSPAALQLKSGITPITPWLRAAADATFQLRPPPFPIATAEGEALAADNGLALDATILLNYTVE